VGHDHMATVNADLGRVIALAAQDHAIDGIGQGQGHEIEANIDRGRIRKNVGDRKTDVDTTALMMINDVSRNL